jgi:hypothetical protein
VNLLQRIKYEAIKLGVQLYVRRKLGNQAMASPLVQQLIAFATSLFSTGDATFGPIAESTTVDIAGNKYQITGTESVEVKKV